MTANREEASSASTSAAALTHKASAFLDSTKDLRLVKSGNGLLCELVSQILAYEDDLDITLADLAPAPTLGANSEAEMAPDRTRADGPRPTDTAGDTQAEINQPSDAEDEKITPSPSAKEIRDRTAADAALSAIISADHNPSKAPSPNQV